MHRHVAEHPAAGALGCLTRWRREIPARDNRLRIAAEADTVTKYSPLSGVAVPHGRTRMIVFPVIRSEHPPSHREPRRAIAGGRYHSGQLVPERGHPMPTAVGDFVHAVAARAAPNGNEPSSRDGHPSQTPMRADRVALVASSWPDRTLYVRRAVAA